MAHLVADLKGGQFRAGLRVKGVQAMPGACQWDLWFPDYAIPVGHGQAAVLPVLVGVPCYSRWAVARMIGSKESADVPGGHLGLVVELGRSPASGFMTASRPSRCAGAGVSSTPPTTCA